ncbi:MAG: hypothetical protein AAGD09_02490 [Cyanobacteria bacterium P01_F01_bin.56]
MLRVNPARSFCHGGGAPARFAGSSAGSILVEGVWHHLTQQERSLALARLAYLLKKDGKGSA